MNKETQEIRNSMGQLEASVDVAQKYMNPDEFSAYCDAIYAAIGKLRNSMRKVGQEIYNGQVMELSDKTSKRYKNQLGAIITPTKEAYNRIISLPHLSGLKLLHVTSLEDVKNHIFDGYILYDAKNIEDLEYILIVLQNMNAQEYVLSL